jgi:hypothetical protein
MYCTLYAQPLTTTNKQVFGGASPGGSDSRPHSGVSPTGTSGSSSQVPPALNVAAARQQAREEERAARERKRERKEAAAAAAAAVAGVGAGVPKSSSSSTAQPSLRALQVRAQALSCTLLVLL